VANGIRNVSSKWQIRSANTEGGTVDDISIDLGTDLADLSDVLLDDLRAVDDTPLAHSIRRILEESEDDTRSVVAGFDNHM
jgi:FXSXX-COOH protein